MHQHQTLDKTYDILRRLHFDYYLLDIENIETTSLLINKSKTYNRTTSYFDNYKQFIIDSGIESTRFVYDYLSLKCFKYTNNGVNPLQLADLVCHIIALLRYGGGISYQLIATGSIYIFFLMNSVMHYPSFTFIKWHMHLWMNLFKFLIITS